MLIDMRIADFPHMKGNQKRKLHREIHRKAYPIKQDDYMKSEDVAKFLQGHFNGR